MLLPQRRRMSLSTWTRWQRRRGLRTKLQGLLRRRKTHREATSQPRRLTATLGRALLDRQLAPRHVRRCKEVPLRGPSVRTQEQSDTERAARWLERYLVEGAPGLQHFAELAPSLAERALGATRTRREGKRCADPGGRPLFAHRRGRASGSDRHIALL